MRLFVSIEPPEDAVEHLDEFLAVRRSSGPELRWSSPAQWHLTLAFMGAAPDRVVEDVVDGVAAVAARTPPARLAVAEVGASRTSRGRRCSGRALPVQDGVDDGVEALGRLARGVRSACSVAGAAPEGGPFVPHLTLGRFSRAEDATRWVRVLSTYAGPTVGRDGGHRRRVAPTARARAPSASRGVGAAPPRRVTPRVGQPFQAQRVPCPQ